ncbi:MAG: tetratricopeptide repeat protein, partial [Deltaproteobacteria bacterium]
LTYLQRGINFVKKKEYEKAIQDFNKAIEIDHLFANAYVQRGIVYGLKKDHEQAIKDYTRAIEINPNHAEAYFNRSLSWSSLGDSAKSLADNEKAGTLDSQYLATPDEGSTDNAKAKEENQETYKIDPKTRSCLEKGTLLNKEGKYPLAIEEYDKVIKNYPDFASAYFYKGLALYNNHEDSKALDNFKKALELDPKNNAYMKIVSNVSKKLKVPGN